MLAFNILTTERVDAPLFVSVSVIAPAAVAPTIIASSTPTPVNILLFAVPRTHVLFPCNVAAIYEWFGVYVHPDK